MSVNAFGRGSATERRPPGLTGIWFKYSDVEGNSDIEDKRLTNIAFP